jgi:hypothetical protein
LNEIIITNNIPRQINILNKVLKKGLIGYLFFGYFFTLGGFFLLIISFCTKSWMFAFIPLIINVSMGIFMLNKAKKTINNRHKCFTEGQIIHGNIISKGRKFNPFSSNRLYTLKVKHGENLTEIIVNSQKKWDSIAVNTQIIGLKWNHNVLFGPELGCTFVLY